MLFPFAAVVTALHALTSAPVYSVVGNTLGCMPYDCAVHLNVPSAISDTFVPFATSLSQKLFGWPVPIKSPDPPEWPTPSKTVYYSHQWYDASAPLFIASPVWSPTLSALAPMPRHALISQGLFVHAEGGSVPANEYGRGALAHGPDTDKDQQCSGHDTMSAAVIDSYGFGLVAQMQHQLVGRIEMWAGTMLAAVIAFDPYFHLAGALVIDLKDVIAKAPVAALRAWQAGVNGILSSKDMMDDSWSEVILWSTTPSAIIRMKEVSAIALVIFMVSLGSAGFTMKTWNHRANALMKDVEEIGYDAFEVSIDEHACTSEQSGKFILDPAMVPLPPAEEDELTLAPEDVPLPEGDDYSLIFGEDDSELTVTEQNGACNVKYTEMVTVFLEPTMLTTVAIDPANIPLPEDDDSWLISQDDEHSVEEQKEIRVLNGAEVLNVPISTSVTANVGSEADDELLEGVYESRATVPECGTGIENASIPLPGDDDDLLELPSEERSVVAETIRFDPADIPLPTEVGDELAEVSLQAANREHDLNSMELAFASEAIDLSLEVNVREVASIGEVVLVAKAIDDELCTYDDNDGNEHAMLCDAYEFPGEDHACFDEPAGKSALDPAMVPLPPAEENELALAPLLDDGTVWAMSSVNRTVLTTASTSASALASIAIDLANAPLPTPELVVASKDVRFSEEDGFPKIIYDDELKAPAKGGSVETSPLEDDLGTVARTCNAIDPASVALPEDDGDWFEPQEGTDLATEVVSVNETLAGEGIDREEAAPRTDYAGDVTAEDAHDNSRYHCVVAMVSGVTERSLEVDVGEMFRVHDVVPPIAGRLHAPEDEDEHAMLMPFPSVALNPLKERESMVFTDVEGDEEVTSDTHYRSVITAHVVPNPSPDPGDHDAFRGISIARSAPSLVVDGVGADQMDAVGLDLGSCELVDDIPKVGSPLDGPAFPGPSLLSESAPSSVVDAQDSAPIVNSRRSRRERIGSLKRMYGSFISLS